MARVFTHLIVLIRNAELIFNRYNLTLGFTFFSPCGADAQKSTAPAGFPRQLMPAWISTKYSYSENNCECRNKEDEFVWFISAIIGCWSSACTHFLSTSTQFLSFPVLSTESSSDLLSLKSEHPFVARLVAKDSYQTNVLVDILEYFNWTYIAVVHSNAEYERNLATNLRKEIRRRKLVICIAYMPVIDDLANITVIEETLIGHLNKVKVIVAISSYIYFSDHFMETVERMSAVFVFSDNTYYPKEGSSNQTIGSFYITFQRSPTPDFVRWYNNLTILNIGTVPFGTQIWQDIFNCCIITDPNCVSCTMSSKLTHLDENDIIIPADRIIDAFAAYGPAMSALASKNCPQALTHRDVIALNRCLVGDELYKTLLDVSFQGASGMVSFDRVGDAEKPHYAIFQQQKSAEFNSRALTQVALWDGQNRLMWKNKLVWRNSTDPPDSMCSKLCPPRHFKLVQTECCWTCHRCRENERLLENNEGCETCPPFQWPSGVEGRTCQPIVVYFTAWNSREAIVAIVLAAAGLILTSITAGALFRWRHTRLIKACSMELSLMTSFGILTGYGCMILFLGEPTLPLCAAQLFFYNMSLTGAYAPLFVKTLRIYRVFAASARGRRPNYVSTRLVITNAFVIWLIMVVIILSLLTWSPPHVVIIQLDLIVPFVESHCPHKVIAFLLPLGINLALVLLCAVLAYKTKALPENFHDAKCIFACATSCVFLWMAFVPSVITSRSVSTENVLLSFALLVNSSVMLVSLFGLKLYAVICHVEVDDNVKFYGGTQSIDVQVAPR